MVLFWKNVDICEKRLFSGRIWPDWGNTTWADMAGLGSVGIATFTNYDGILCIFSDIASWCSRVS